MRSALADTFSSASSRSVPPPQSPPLPLVFDQVPEGAGRFVLIGLLAPALTVLLAPFWLVATQLASDPAARAVLAERPLVGGQLLAGLVMLIWIFGWPLARLSSTALARRRVTIADGLVRLDTVSLLGARSRVLLLGDFVGIAFRPRTSLSGVCWDIVLVHREPSRFLVLGPAPHIAEATAEALARLFAVAEIPSRDVASVSSPHGYFHAAEPQPRLAA